MTHAVQRAHEHIAFPCGKTVAGIKEHAGGRNRGRPVTKRLDETAFGMVIGNRQHRIMRAVTGFQSAVILAYLLNIDLIAASRAMLGCP